MTRVNDRLFYAAPSKKAVGNCFMCCIIFLGLSCNADIQTGALFFRTPPSNGILNEDDSDLIAERDDKTRLAEQQYAIALAEQNQRTQEALRQIRERITSLNNDIEKKQAAADSSRRSALALRQSLLNKRKITPTDPWRVVNGETKYLVPAGPDFVKFSGQILEIAPEGMRVLGDYGDRINNEFFIAHFPYPSQVGDRIDPSKQYSAFEDGTFTYITEDGYAKSLPKLDYGTPCARPPDADLVESNAQELTPDDYQQISSAFKNAIDKRFAVDLAQQTLRDYVLSLVPDRKAAVAKLVAWTQQQADKGDTYGLLRMGERYRDGDGVERNLQKSREYLQKAAKAGSLEASRELSKLEENVASKQ